MKEEVEEVQPLPSRPLLDKKISVAVGSQNEETCNSAGDASEDDGEDMQGDASEDVGEDMQEGA